MYKLHIRNYILIAEHLGLAQGNRNWTQVAYRHPQFQCMLSSSRNASHILSALAASNLCAAPAVELIISPSAIHQARKDNRAALAAEIRESFDPNVPLTIHWDGKIMPDLTGTERGCVDRLLIMVSGKDVTKLLVISKLKSGTAAVMSDACLSEIRSWGLEDRIVAMCFDTTASNTGCKGGVCIKLEAELGKDLLNLACRHHCLKLFWKRCFHCMILQGLENWNYSVISVTSGRKSIRPSIAQQWMIKMQHSASVSQKFETM